MRNIIFVVFGLCMTVAGYSQQERQYTQFMHNKLSFNAGYAGSYEFPCATAVYRNQWIGLEGAPKSMTVGFDMPLKDNKIGLGFNLHSTKVGISTQLTADAVYAYGLQMESGRLAIGFQLSARYLRNNYNDSRLQATEGLDEDASIPVGQISKIIPNFGAGVYYSNEKFYIGASVPRLFESNIDLSEATPEIGAEIRHIYAMGGVLLRLNDKLQVQPQGLLKYAINTPMDAEVNLNFIYNQQFTIGTTLRMGGDQDSFAESLDIISSVYLTPVFMIGLSYDVTLSQLRTSNKGSVEAVVRYCIVEKQKEDIINPRFF